MRYSQIVGKKTWDSTFLKEFVIVLDIIESSQHLVGSQCISLIGGIFITYDVCSSLRTKRVSFFFSDLVRT